MASLWIRRLKPREELDSLKGETLVSDDGTQQGLHVQNSDAGGSMHPFGSHLQEAFSTKTWENKPFSKISKLDGKNPVLNEQIYSSEGQDYVAEKQQNLIKQVKGKLTLFADPHTSGKLKNQIADEEKLPMTRCTSEAAVALHMRIQAAESKSQVLHAVRMQAAEVGILASSLGKPPLPPSHNKAGLPPRSAGYNFSSFLARSAGKISSSSPTNSKLVQDTGRHPLQTAVMKEGLPAPIDSTEPLLIEGCQSKEDSMGCQGPFSKENGICTETRCVLPSTQIAKSVSFSQEVVPSAEFGMQQHGVCHSEGTYSSLSAKPPKKIARQEFEAMDVNASGAESLKKLNGLELSEKAPSTLLKEGNMLKTPSETMVVSSQTNLSMEATVSPSTTARFPWEMFAGAAGSTRSARDEFVEVYNRARNELKSHKSSSSIAKVFHKEMENCPDCAFGQAICLQDTMIVEHEEQPLDGQPQREIPGKRCKVEGLDCVAQHKGSKVTATCPQLPQKEPLLEKHDCASFLDGDADVRPEKKLQAFQSVHGMCGKKSSSFMHGEDGGPPAAVGQKNCKLTFVKSSQCRQGFEGTASTHHKPFQAAHVEQTDRIPHDNMKTLMQLGKRQPEMFDSGSGIITGKESFQCITLLPRKSDAWLQRWYPPYTTSVNGSQEYKHSDFDGLGQNSAAGSKLMAKESHEHRACVKEAFKRRLIEKGVLYKRIMAGEQPECSKASSEKVLPSAAAMAIVGTAARHFCMAEPQEKGSFAFWSGFGMQNYQTQEHYTEKGKRKLTFEVDPSA